MRRITVGSSSAPLTPTFLMAASFARRKSSGLTQQSLRSPIYSPGGRPFENMLVGLGFDESIRPFRKMSCSRIISTPDGRQLRLFEAGQSDGVPVLA